MVCAQTSDQWQARAAMCELLALSFRYPDAVLAEALASGEWGEAADEIAGVVGLSWTTGAAPGAAEAAQCDDADELLHTLRCEATRLYVGTPEPVVSPYEGVWRAEDEGVKALLFVNPHSMEVERFCGACGLGRPVGTNEPLDHVATEMELLQYLAERAAIDVSDADAVDLSACPGEYVLSQDLPGGSAAAAYQQFMDEHVMTWMPRFAAKVKEETEVPFYADAADLLAAFLRVGE